MDSKHMNLVRLRQLAGKLEVRTLGLLLLAAGAVWVFLELADEVVEGETRAFDEAILLIFRTANDTSEMIGPPWFEELGRDLTALGGTGVLALITLAAAGFLWLQNKRRHAWFVLGAVGSGVLLSSFLKIGFERPRPDLVPHEVLVQSASFPSGHSTMAALVYLTLAALLARAQEGRALKAYLFALAMLLLVLVGVSRIYLGVHWPTDVLAGWAIGAAWALLFWSIAQLLDLDGPEQGR